MPSIHVYNLKLFFKVHDYVFFVLLPGNPQLKTELPKKSVDRSLTAVG